MINLFIEWVWICREGTGWIRIGLSVEEVRRNEGKKLYKNEWWESLHWENGILHLNDTYTCIDNTEWCLKDREKGGIYLIYSSFKSVRESFNFCIVYRF